MKKILLILLSLSVFAASIFAITGQEINNDFDAADRYESEKVQTQTIVPEQQHVVDKNAKVTIEFNPLYDEVRIYYVTNYVTFDRGEAMNTVLAVLQDFQKEHGYVRYRYLSEPKEKSFIDSSIKPKKKYTQYFCYVQMLN